MTRNNMPHKSKGVKKVKIKGWAIYTPEFRFPFQVIFPTRTTAKEFARDMKIIPIVIHYTYPLKAKKK